MRLPEIAVFRHRGFAAFWIARVCLVLAQQAQVTALGWLIYARADAAGRSTAEIALLLGVMGLVQFAPLLLLSLLGGHVADRYDRRLILIVCVAFRLAASGLLAAAALAPLEAALGWAFAAVALIGAVNGFQPAAAQALLPTLVPRAALPQAIALNALAFTSASIVGPALGGLLYGVGGASLAFGAAAALLCLALLIFVRLRAPKAAQAANAPHALAQIREGLAYVRRNQILLGAISLDLAATLLAGAQALLPLFAGDILGVGPDGHGALRAAIAAGAACVALALAFAPLRRNVGRWMYASVGLFALATLVFGLSTQFWLTLVALATAGAADMVSVNVRQSLIQLATPDALRGRVASVSFVFISASNELGDFEAGLMARLLGPALAVASGGVAALAVTAAWIRLFPMLWRIDSFEDALDHATETPVAFAAKS